MIRPLLHSTQLPTSAPYLTHPAAHAFQLPQTEQAVLLTKDLALTISSIENVLPSLLILSINFNNISDSIFSSSRDRIPWTTSHIPGYSDFTTYFLFIIASLIREIFWFVFLFDAYVSPSPNYSGVITVSVWPRVFICDVSQNICGPIFNTRLTF